MVKRPEVKKFTGGAGVGGGAVVATTLIPLCKLKRCGNAFGAHEHREREQAAHRHEAMGDPGNAYV